MNHPTHIPIVLHGYLLDVHDNLICLYSFDEESVYPDIWQIRCAW